MKKRTRKPTKTDSCHGKKQMSEEEAEEMVQYRMDCGAAFVESYHCRFCGYFHTGTRKKAN